MAQVHYVPVLAECVRSPSSGRPLPLGLHVQRPGCHADLRSAMGWHPGSKGFAMFHLRLGRSTLQNYCSKLRSPAPVEARSRRVE